MDSNKKTVSPVLVLFLLLSGSELVASQRGQSDPRTNPSNYGGRLSPMVAVFVVGLVTVLFFMGFLIFYIRHYTSGINHTGVTNVAVARGLDTAMIETFPTFAYSEVKTQMIGKGVLECAICLNEFENDETLRLLPKCDHVFHPKCIDAWLQNHVTCPICRTNLSEPDEPEAITKTDLEAQYQSAIPEPAMGLSESVPRVKFSRSYSTGYLVILPEENRDRFTLKLAKDFKKNVTANWKLNRQNSLFLIPMGESSRSGKHVDQSTVRSDRWLFRKTPSFLWRNQEDSTDNNVKANAIPSPTSDSVQADPWAFLRNQSFLRRSKPVPRVGVSKDDEETSSVTSDSFRGSVRLPV